MCRPGAMIWQAAPPRHRYRCARLAAKKKAGKSCVLLQGEEGGLHKMTTHRTWEEGERRTAITEKNHAWAWAAVVETVFISLMLGAKTSHCTEGSRLLLFSDIQ